ncbi:protease inhibitor I42 family protein [Streptomyces sp. NPDC016309]|uniref:protease inhibitor I42 family protein n=1 Tax=Streptomyces sp. NPDC016309 TaxID=3364965 RepID=UPI0036F95E63
MIKRLIPASLTARCLLVAAVAVVATLLVLAAGGSHRAGHTVTHVVGPTAYGPAERRITVAAGDDFTLEVPARPYMGEHWYLADPAPDADVLAYGGTHEDIEGTDEDVAGGGDGTAYFDFTARAEGTTTVTLLHCPLARCGSVAAARASAVPVPTAGAAQTPGGEPAFFRYEITVR